MVGELLFLKWNRSSKIVQNMIFHVNSGLVPELNTAHDGRRYARSYGLSDDSLENALDSSS